MPGQDRHPHPGRHAGGAGGAADKGPARSPGGLDGGVPDPHRRQQRHLPGHAGLLSQPGHSPDAHRKNSLLLPAEVERCDLPGAGHSGGGRARPHDRHAPPGGAERGDPAGQTGADDCFHLFSRRSGWPAPGNDGPGRLGPLRPHPPRGRPHPGLLPAGGGPHQGHLRRPPGGGCRRGGPGRTGGRLLGGHEPGEHRG